MTTTRFQFSGARRVVATGLSGFFAAFTYTRTKRLYRRRLQHLDAARNAIHPTG
ncbi:MAG: hypothetical protein IPK79_02390 [Vampirovibrionales bacterium]|nr:hypothetical protein [Vampirovibrionales bacterium]